MRRTPTIVAGRSILVFFVMVALFPPWIAGDPLGFDPLNRLKRPSAEFWFGTDQLGRDLFSRVVYGTRISLIVGISVAAIATVIGLLLGVLCGYYPGSAPDRARPGRVPPGRNDGGVRGQNHPRCTGHRRASPRLCAACRKRLGAASNSADDAANCEVLAGLAGNEQVALDPIRAGLAGARPLALGAANAPAAAPVAAPPAPVPAKP